MPTVDCVCQGCELCGGSATQACGFAVSRKSPAARAAQLCHWCGAARFGGAEASPPPPPLCVCTGCDACKAWRSHECGTDVAKRHKLAKKEKLCHYCGVLRFGVIPSEADTSLHRLCLRCGTHMNRTWCRQCGIESAETGGQAQQRQNAQDKNRSCPWCQWRAPADERFLVGFVAHLMEHHNVVEAAVPDLLVK